MGVTGCNATFGKLFLLASHGDFLEIPVTTRYKNKPVTRRMDTSLLVQRLSERGIKLSVVDGKLTCDSERPIPKAILTTINAEEQQLLEYLNGTAATKQPAPVLVPAADEDTYRPAAPPAEERARYVRPPANENDTGIPRLPWQIERFLSAASSGQLSVELSGVPDAQRYVLAWGCSYLTGDRAEALRRLWEVRHAWQPEVN